MSEQSDRALAAVREAATNAAAVYHRHVDRVLLGQLDTMGGPIVGHAPILESVRDALRMLDEATRTILVAPADQHRMEEAVSLFPLVKVVASPLVDSGTAYLVNTGVLEVAYDPPRLTGPQGGPIPTNAAIKIVDTA